MLGRWGDMPLGTVDLRLESALTHDALHVCSFLLKNNMGLQSARPWAWMVALSTVCCLPGPGMVGSIPWKCDHSQS